MGGHIKKWAIGEWGKLRRDGGEAGEGRRREGDGGTRMEKLDLMERIEGETSAGKYIY